MTGMTGRRWPLPAAMAAALFGLAAPAPAGASLPPPTVFQWPARNGPAIATEAEARRALLLHGLRDVTRLGPVGDYWEANARAHGRRVVAYLFTDGTLRIDRHPTEMVQLGSRLSPPRGAS
jgi:hypothetical protein